MQETTMTSISVDASGLTSVGQEREQNEDQFLIANILRVLQVQMSSMNGELSRRSPEAAEGALLLVADGMGGQGGGDVASALAIRAVAADLSRVVPWVERPMDRASRASRLTGVRYRMQHALVQGDAAVQQAAGRGEGTPSMGTTLTAAYVCFPKLYLAHVGDSRCYLLREGELYRMTHDHTMAEQLRVELGTEVEPDSPWNHVLWNALGGGNNAEIRPEVHRCDLDMNDVLLLCSDGLTKHVDDQRICDTLNDARSVQEACESLVSMANAGGGTDNITVIVARLVAEPAPQA